ncbi:hypothetical protein TNCV_1992581 [Trichonephila clavipes]|nr:hypothetical protein TNCV_1992581 [Trichonephila clavipes]
MPQQSRRGAREEGTRPICFRLTCFQESVSKEWGQNEASFSGLEPGAKEKQSCYCRPNPARREITSEMFLPYAQINMLRSRLSLDSLLDYFVFS